MDLIHLEDLNASQIQNILSRASFFLKSPPTHNILANQFVANLFFENSTRTRFSFEIAAKRLGAHVLNFDEQFSSTKKGETVYDTLKVLESMGVHAAIIRHSDEHVWDDLRGQFSLKLINAGTGTTSHPTQALLDAHTLQAHFGKIAGLTISIIGDIRHSRVARSNMDCLKKLGANVLLSAPPAFSLDQEFQNCSLDEALKKADVVMLLRIQKERHDENYQIHNYLQEYGLTPQRMEMMKPQAVIMHPGPFNRNVEIASELVEHPRSLIFKQVAHGVCTRMAVLEWALKENV